eukprot:g4225.t1
MNDLRDGIILIDVFAEISPEHCDVSKSDTSNPVRAVAYVVDAIESYYSTAVGLDWSVGKPEAIVKGDDADLVGLVKKILGCAVQCPKKSVFVDRIMKMSQASQAQLMVMIDKAMKAQQAATNDETEEDEEEEDAFGEEDEDDFMVDDYDNDAAAFDSVTKERDRLRGRVAELEDIVESNRMRADGNEEESAKAMQERVDRLKAKEKERLRQAKNAFSRRELELQDVIRDLQLQLSETKGKLEIHTKHSEATIQRMNVERQSRGDELDVLRTKVAHLPKIEAQLVQAEKRLEKSSNLREQIADMEKQSREYLEKMLDMEAEIETISLLKKQIDDKQSQIVTLTTTATKHEMELLSKDERLKEIESQLEAEKTKTGKMGESLKVARGRGDNNNKSNSSSRGGSNVAVETPAAGDSLAVVGFDAAKAREKIARLERENDRLRKRPPQVVAAAPPPVDKEKESKQRRDSDLLEKKLVAATSALEKKGTEQAELERKLASTTRALEKKNVEQAKLENYVKQALAHANKTVKQSQQKYKNSLRMLKSQIEQKQKEITYFSDMLEKSKSAHRREERLLMSTIYKIGLDLNSRLLRNEALGVGQNAEGTPRSWLGKRRVEQRRGVRYK